MEEITIDFMTKEAQEEYEKVYKYKDEFFVGQFVDYKIRGITISDEEAGIINIIKGVFRGRRINLHNIEPQIHPYHKDILSIWINGEEVDPDYESGDYAMKLLKESVKNYENVRVTDTRCGSFSINLSIKRE